jgi:spermidine synthase
MPMLALCGRGQDEPIDLRSLAPRLQSKALQSVVQRLDLATPLAIAGTYVGGADALRRYAGAGPLNTDDHPVIALNGAANIAALLMPVQDLLLDLLHALRARGAETTPAGLDATQWDRYRRARDLFLEAGAALQDDPRGRALIAAATPGLLAAVTESADFDPAYQPLLQMADALAAEDPDAARGLLQQMNAVAPSRPEARQRLRQWHP